MFAILNQPQDADRRDESPTVPVLSGAQKQQQEEIETRIAELEKLLVAPDTQNLAALVKWEAGLVGEADRRRLPLAFQTLGPFPITVRRHREPVVSERSDGARPGSTPRRRSPL